VPIVLKSGRLSLLEPLGTVQACNGIALHFNLLFDIERKDINKYSNIRVALVKELLNKKMCN